MKFPEVRKVILERERYLEMYHRFLTHNNDMGCKRTAELLFKNEMNFERKCST